MNNKESLLLVQNEAVHEAEGFVSQGCEPCEAIPTERSEALHEVPTERSEQILLSDRGGFMPYALRSWQLGEICLTTKHLLFLKNGGKVFEVDINSMVDIAIEKRKFILVKKDVIKLLFEKKSQILSVRFITPNVHAWFEYLDELIPKAPRIIVAKEQDGKMAQRQEEKIASNHLAPSPLNSLTLLPLNPLISFPPRPSPSSGLEVSQKPPEAKASISMKDFSFLMRQFEPDCEEILNYLLQNRHAKIDQLAELIDAPTHMSVLLKIRKNINPTAQKVIGQPILTFEEKRQDPVTGENVVFSWWLADEVIESIKDTVEEPQVDVFDEGDHILIVVDLAGAKEDDIQLEVIKNKLVVSAVNFSKKYHAEIPLSRRGSATALSPATPPQGGFVDNFKTKFNNGILSVVVEKETNEDE